VPGSLSISSYGTRLPVDVWRLAASTSVVNKPPALRPSKHHPHLLAGTLIGAFLERDYLKQGRIDDRDLMS
jgi:hypothetical protein